MKSVSISRGILLAGLLVAAPAFAQTSPAQKQRTQDGNSPTTVGPGSAAYKQHAQDGNSPTSVGAGSRAYKQKAQNISRSGVLSRQQLKED